jgi:hypothetical protein
MLRLYSFRFLLPAFLLLLSFFALDCRTTPTGPTDAYIAPGRRDYIWKIDTVTTDPFINLYRMWGSGPGDIWAVTGRTFHFDGKKWTEQKGLYLSVIYGFNQNDIWAANNGAIIKFYHFSGAGWHQTEQIIFDDSSSVFISDIWGETPDDIYACGFVAYQHSPAISFLCHYDGKTWTVLNIPKTDYYFGFCRTWHGRLFILAEKASSDGSTYSIIEYVNNNFKDIISNANDVWMSRVGHDLMFIWNKKLYRFNESLELYVDLAPFAYLGGGDGRNSKDIFCWVWPNILSHFNGTDLVPIFELPADIPDAYGPLFFDKSVTYFAKTSKSGISVAITGTLPDTTTR